MIISEVKKTDAEWILYGSNNEKLVLPAAHSGPFQIGLVGTRSGLVNRDKTKKFASMLADLSRPLMLIDVRRSGMGGSGSWGPLEFSTVIPNLIGKEKKFSYFHLPLAAPTLDLLTSYRQAAKLKVDLDPQALKSFSFKNAVPDHAWKHWQVFSKAYAETLSDNAVLAGRAFVEAASVVGAIPIFLCAEEHCPEFESREQKVQDEHYCHRYTLSAAIRDSIRAEFASSNIEQISLRLGAEPTVLIL